MRILIVVISLQITFWVCRPMTVEQTDAACETTCCTPSHHPTPSSDAPPVKWCVTCLAGCCFVVPPSASLIGPVPIGNVMTFWIPVHTTDVVKDIWKPPNANVSA